MITLLLGQLLTLAAQLAYVYAFRGAFVRQTRTLRARPGASLLTGIGVVVGWWLVGLVAVRFDLAHQSAWLNSLVTVVFALMAVAATAVVVAVAAAKVLRWEPEQRPFQATAVGQAAAVLLTLLLVGLMPRLAVFLLMLYVSAGLGAVALAEFSSTGEEVRVPRLGLQGLACLLVLSAVITFGMMRAGERMGREAAAIAPPVPSAQP